MRITVAVGRLNPADPVAEPGWHVILAPYLRRSHAAPTANWRNGIWAQVARVGTVLVMCTSRLSCAAAAKGHETGLVPRSAAANPAQDH
jgi:hypothetical protein